MTQTMVQNLSQKREEGKNKKALMVIAFENFKDEEYFLPKEILEKGGVEVKTASPKKGIAIGSEGGEAKVDLLIEEVDLDEFEAVIFVGGPGALDYLDNEKSYALLRKAKEKQKIISAICIAPLILAKAGILSGKKATVWSSPFDRQPIQILEERGAIFVEKSVVVDGKIITANGPSAAEEFGKTILKLLTLSLIHI